MHMIHRQSSDLRYALCRAYVFTTPELASMDANEVTCEECKRIDRLPFNERI